MQVMILFCAAWLFAIVSWGDLRTRRIPNELSLAVAGLGILRLAAAGDLLAAGYTLAAGGAIFAVAFLLFSRGMLGGGDAKLITAVSLLIGYDDLMRFLLVMGICGAALALLALAEDRLRRLLGCDIHVIEPRPATPAEVAAAMAPTVPYGVAIAVAGLWVLMSQLLIG